MPTDRTYSLLLTLDDNHHGRNTRHLVATVVSVDEHGHLYSASEYRAPEEAALADFRITAFLDSSEEHAWGFSHGYQPYLVDLDRAETIVRTLRKIAKGLDKATTEQGHVTDFADYLFRVAKILRIRSFYLRNSDRRREITGQMFSQVDAASVQHWVREQEQQYAKQPAHAG